MATRILRGSPAVATVATVTTSIVALTTLLAACGGSPSSGAPSAATTTASPQASVAGPTDFAAWTERQGFGGSSGLANVAKLVGWVRDHPGDGSTWDIDDEAADIAALTAWLDTHPATSCWAEYHAAVRASLVSFAAGYAAARVEVQAGRSVPETVTTAMTADAQKATSLPAPAGCP
jgi:hypothetical protein